MHGVSPTVTALMDFNPRTPVGCDVGRPSPRRSCLPNFNPRTPVGCDRAQAFERVLDDAISIHAPQWGATSGRCPRSFHWRHFNPRTPVGCDSVAVPPGFSRASFQSTHPSGVRPVSTPQYLRLPNFNPRTPVGCDTPYTGAGRRARGFQSTHPSGVRRYPPEYRSGRTDISIHAPQWGATCRAPTPDPHSRNFNPRTPVGCDAQISHASSG